MLLGLCHNRLPRAVVERNTQAGGGAPLTPVCGWLGYKLPPVNLGPGGTPTVEIPLEGPWVQGPVLCVVYSVEEPVQPRCRLPRGMLSRVCDEPHKKFSRDDSISCHSSRKQVRNTFLTAAPLPPPLLKTPLQQILHQSHHVL
jgi:hypothetical protein